jgi:chorismate dehydratase
VTKIKLDYQSRTSVNLCKVLCKNHWHVAPRFEQATEGYENNINSQEAAVIIGDRTFSLDESYPYVYDLSEEWYKMTGLPFVFAAWVANKEIPSEFITEFNAACANGIDQIDEAIEFGNINIIDKAAQKKYLTESISYTLDNEKRKGLDLFLKLLTEL